MTVKDWLSRGRNLDKEINTLINEQRQAFESATGTVPSIDEKVQTTRHNSTENRFINYASYSALIDKRIDKLYEIKQEILLAIAKVDNATLRTLLTMRYINFYTWEKIACEMNYSYMQVCRLHGKALSKIKDVIECYIDSVI